MTSLYKLTDELVAAQRDLDEMLGNEVITTEEYDDSLAAMYNQRDVKASSVIAFIKNDEADAAMYKAEADKLLKRAKSSSKRAESNKAYLYNQMAKLDQTTAGEGVHTAKIKQGSMRCEITGEVAEKWSIVKTVITPDKVAITRAIKAGESIEGAELVRGPSSIKIN